jgi:ABC-type lipoprotein export system ATPase subunit
MVTHSPMAAEYGDTKIQLKNGKLHHLDSIGIKVNMNVLIN